MVGWFSVVVGVTPSAATACAWKANPIRTEAAPKNTLQTIESTIKGKRYLFGMV